MGADMRTEAFALAVVVMACDGATRPTVGSSSSTPEASSVPTAAPPASATGSAGPGAYSCPMHPEVRGAGPGDCPSCGMPLEPTQAPAPNAASSASPRAEASGYRLELRSAPLEPGKRVEVDVSFAGPKGEPLGAPDFKVVHEQRIHLLIIDESLTDYHHEHPATRADGPGLRFSFTPRKPGPYRVFADVVPEATRRQLYLMADLSAGARGEPISNRETVTKAAVDGYTFEIELSGALREGEPSSGVLSIRDRAGEEVKNLEPVMGAYAHLVGFFDDRVSVEHVHPMGPEPAKPTDRGRGTLKFRFTPKRSGLMRFFAQVKLEGTERFAPFTLQVAPRDAK